MGERLTKKLIQSGLQVEPYRLSEKSLPIGVKFILDNAELVYRVEGDSLIFIIFKQSRETPGLSNAFAPVLWFFEFLKTQDVSISNVKAIANPLPRAGGKAQLDRARLRAFYKRYFKARDLVYDQSPEWLQLDLSDFHCSIPVAL